MYVSYLATPFLFLLEARDPSDWPERQHACVTRSRWLENRSACPTARRGQATFMRPGHGRRPSRLRPARCRAMTETLRASGQIYTSPICLPVNTDFLPPAPPSSPPRRVTAG